MSEAIKNNLENQRRRGLDRERRQEWLAKESRGTKLPETLGMARETGGEEAKTEEEKAIALKAEQNKEGMAKKLEKGPSAMAGIVGKGEGVGGAAEALAAKAGQMGTGFLLKWMWSNIWWVLPLIYINFHFFLRYLIGVEYFCRFGEELKGGGMAGAGGKGGVGEITGTANKGMEILEIMALVGLDLLVLFAILGILALIGLIANPWDLIKTLGAWILNAITPWPSKKPSGI